MRRRSKVFLATVGALCALTPAVAHAADQPVAGEATLVGAQGLPAWSTLPVYKEGGFSGLYPVAGEPGHFWTVSDRGPNGEPAAANGNRRPFPSPSFTPSIYKIAVDTASQQMTIVGRYPIKLPVGSVNPARTGSGSVGGDLTHVTGFANSGVNAGANIPTSDEIPTGDTDLDGDIDTVDANLPFDPYGVDTEGITIDPRDGSFWLVEEYRPSVLHVAADGTILHRYTPAGQTNAALGPAWDAVPLDDVLPASYSRRRANRGFEGVAIDPTGTRLYAIVQNPLAETCAGNDPFAPGTDPYVTINDQRSATRIAEIDITDPANPVLLGDYVYTLDTDPGTGITVNPQLRIGDLFYAGPSKLLVLERDDTYGEIPGDTYKRVYEVDLSAATNVQTLAGPNQTCISAVKPANLDDRGITPVTKTLKLDLAATTLSPEYPYDKLEGLVKLPNGNFATIDDNDFQVPNPDKPTKYIEYGVEAPAPVVPEAPYVVLLPLAALAVGGASVLVLRRRPARV